MSVPFNIADFACYSVGLKGDSVVLTTGNALDPKHSELSRGAALQIASSLVYNAQQIAQMSSEEWDKFEKDCNTG